MFFSSKMLTNQICSGKNNYTIIQNYGNNSNSIYGAPIDLSYKKLRFAKILLQYLTRRILLYLIIKKMRAVSRVWLAEGILILVTVMGRRLPFKASCATSWVITSAQAIICQTWRQTFLVIYILRLPQYYPNVVI